MLRGRTVGRRTMRSIDLTTKWKRTYRERGGRENKHKYTNTLYQLIILFTNVVYFRKQTQTSLLTLFIATSRSLASHTCRLPLAHTSNTPAARCASRHAFTVFTPLFFASLVDSCRCDVKINRDYCFLEYFYLSYIQVSFSCGLR